MVFFQPTSDGLSDLIDLTEFDHASWSKSVISDKLFPLQIRKGIEDSLLFQPLDGSGRVVEMTMIL